MTYQDVANWCEKNVPMGQAESVSDWISMCEQEFVNAGHFLPEEVLPLLQKKWSRAHPEERPQIEESRFDKFEKEREKERITIGQKLERRIDKFPQDFEFSPIQLSKFTGVNKNTTRRELQELVAEGKLQRVSRGRYRQAP